MPHMFMYRLSTMHHFMDIVNKGFEPQTSGCSAVLGISLAVTAFTFVLGRDISMICS